MIRHLVYTSREDLIPEFRYYGGALEKWDGNGTKFISLDDLKGLSVNKIMDRMLQSSAYVDEIFNAVHQVLAWNMLHFDLEYDLATENAIKHNIGWLDFTHGLTFANAARIVCDRYPQHWPQVLLQLACFAGRNVSYVDQEQNVSHWLVNDQDQFFKAEFNRLIDHGVPEPIISCHLMKVLTAVREDCDLLQDIDTKKMILASVNRFLNSPLKRKHGLRTARQALNFVALEG